MEKEKPRLARLTAILTQLQSKRIVTARDIAEKHKVSIRTIYRDIRTLEQSGIPIVTEEGKGYSLLEGYKLPPIMFTEEEANALITAEQIISKNKDQSLSTQYASAVEKIKSVLRYTQKEKTELLEQRIYVRTNPEKETTSSYLIQLQSAITNFQLMDMDYLSLDDNRSQRKVEPFAMFSTNENWILVAYCRLRKEFRAFRLDRIQDLKPSPNFFEPHKISFLEYFEECRRKNLKTP